VIPERGGLVIPEWGGLIPTWRGVSIVIPAWDIFLNGAATYSYLGWNENIPDWGGFSAVIPARDIFLNEAQQVRTTRTRYYGTDLNLKHARSTYHPNNN